MKHCVFGRNGRIELPNTAQQGVVFQRIDKKAIEINQKPNIQENRSMSR